jgi:hypothetical protein
MIILEGTGIGSQDPTAEQIKDIPKGTMYCFVYKRRSGPDGTWWRWSWPWYLAVYRHSGSFSPRYDRIYGLGGAHVSRKKAFEEARRILREDADLWS